jgi:hypothetical protein
MEFIFIADVNTHSNIDTPSYTSINSLTPSSVTINGDVSGDVSGSSNFDIDFNEPILQVHKR